MENYCEKKRILVIEDEVDFQHILEQSLGKNYTLDFALDGETGLDKINTNDYDLLILDVNLPRMNGWDVLREIRRSSDDKIKSLPVVMLTVRKEDQDQLTGLDMGADDYIPKPFNPPELILRIDAVLRRAIA